jgi:hypothetical protein
MIKTDERTMQINPYAPPDGSATADSMVDTSIKSIWLRRAVFLLYVKVMIYPILELLDIQETMAAFESEGWRSFWIWLVLTPLFFLFEIWVTFQVSLGRNWARMILLLLSGFVCFGLWAGKLDLDWIFILHTILECICLSILFLSPAKHCFTKNKVAQNVSDH